jgi:hypothetical protein
MFFLVARGSRPCRESQDTGETPLRRTIPAFSALLAHAVLLSICFLAGCRPSTPAISVEPTDSKQVLNQHFTRAFFALDDSGSDQVVLVNDPIDQKPAGPPGGPLPSAEVSPIRQVFVAGLHWRAAPGTMSGSVAAANAVLDWYVYGGPGAGNGLIHYQGTGFVVIEGRGATGKVEIQDGQLRRVEKIGDLIDPFKSFAVSGTFQASQNSEQVQAVLADITTAVAAARASVPPPSPAPSQPATAPTTAPATAPAVTTTTLP